MVKMCMSHGSHVKNCSACELEINVNKLFKVKPGFPLRVSDFSDFQFRNGTHFHGNIEKIELAWKFVSLLQLSSESILREVYLLIIRPLSFCYKVHPKVNNMSSYGCYKTFITLL